MSLEIAIKKYTNPEYRVNYSESSNIRTVVFEKDFGRYEYLFLLYSQESYYMIVADRESHNEIKNIFNSNVLDHMDADVSTVHHDLNFMHMFCFGTASGFEKICISDIMNVTHVSGRTALEYAGMTIENDGISFLMTYKLEFNTNTGVLGYNSNYTYFDKNYNTVVESTIWDLFKNEFMRFHAANKIEKKLSDLTFFDAPIIQMINI